MPSTDTLLCQRRDIVHQSNSEWSHTHLHMTRIRKDHADAVALVDTYHEWGSVQACQHLDWEAHEAGEEGCHWYRNNRFTTTPMLLNDRLAKQELKSLQCQWHYTKVWTAREVMLGLMCTEKYSIKNAERCSHIPWRIFVCLQLIQQINPYLIWVEEAREVGLVTRFFMPFARISCSRSPTTIGRKCCELKSIYEEAATRVLLHAKIIGEDTDILVLALGVNHTIPCQL